jgi:hypothetical protein
LLGILVHTTTHHFNSTLLNSYSRSVGGKPILGVGHGRLSKRGGKMTHRKEPKDRRILREGSKESKHPPHKSKTRLSHKLLELRQQIREGTYDCDRKIQAVLDPFLQELL